MNSIEDELVGYMDRHAADTPTKARDIQIVAHYYGFDETPWPTLEATAARFGINTRERVRQIIENRFRASATLQNLPHARSAATLLRSRAFWFTSELQAELNALGEPNDPSLRGLLNLLHDLQAAERYEIYDHNLVRVARAAYAPDENYVVATDEVVKRLRPSLRTAFKLPGQLGLTSSAIVHVDRSSGRGSYTYSLVGGTAPRGHTKSDRYKDMLKRLKTLEDIGTDAPTETKARREQRLLCEWLFDGKAKEDCAICGREFSVRSLVAAHKKRRAECSRTERLDPYIVMPLCLLGCDHLYERGLVWIEAGRLVTINDTTLGATERAVLKALDGRRLAAPWMKGPEKYFRPPRSTK